MNKKRYKKSLKILAKWSDLYYDGIPEVGDGVFDSLLKEVKDYENIHNIKSDVTSSIQSVSWKGFLKSNHIIKMYSLKDMFDISDVLKWIKLVNVKLVIEPKYDGLSLSLTYEDGILVKAVTRGDGLIGDDVTLNAKAIVSIPNKISYKGSIIILGEVVMPKSIFKSLNELRLKHGEDLFSNPRNAASGSLKQKDPMITTFRNLSFYPFDVHSDEDAPISKKLERIEKYGFNKGLFRITATLDNIEKVYNDTVSNLDSFDILLDGLVIKADITSDRDRLGVVDKFPKYAIAFKFPNKETISKVINIINQVGKTGIITPVAEIEPVYIDGVRVARSTLHNYNEVLRLGLKIKDSIVLTRSGDVIPKILKVLPELRTGEEIDIVEPTLCPSCQSELIDLRCENKHCPDIVKFAILHFTSRERMNIQGLGESIIANLVNNSIISTYSDLYKLTKDDLSFLGNKVSDKILGNIESSRNITMDKLLSSIGIPMFGRRVSKKLVNSLGDVDYTNISFKQLTDTDGIGDELAIGYVSYMKENKNDVNELIKIMNITIEKNITKSNIRIVITGSFDFSRNELKEKLSKLGVTVSSSVTKNTDLLVYGDKPGSKLKAARELKITLLDGKFLSVSEIIDSILSIGDAPF